MAAARRSACSCRDRRAYEERERNKVTYGEVAEELGSVAWGPEPTSRSLGIVVCDDHKMMIDALRFGLDAFPDVDADVRAVSTAEQAVEVCRSVQPDVCVMDVHLGSGTDGIEATRRIREGSPETKVIILSADASEERIVDSLEAGAAGYVPKSEPLSTIVKAIVTVGRGGSVIDLSDLPGMIERTSRARAARAEVGRKLERLTAREREVLGLLRHGKSNPDIAQELFISSRTVDTHIQNILRKLRLHSRLEAATFAMRHL
jgi:DNA-binding NarL/FixJ family response regulator